MRVRQSRRILSIALRKFLQIHVSSTGVVLPVPQRVLRISLWILLEVYAEFSFDRELIVNQVIVRATVILVSAALRILVQIFVARVIVLFQFGIQFVGLAKLLVLGALLRGPSRRIFRYVCLVNQLSRILDDLLGYTRGLSQLTVERFYTRRALSRHKIVHWTSEIVARRGLDARSVRLWK